MKRKRGITVLVLWNYLNAALMVLTGMVILFSPSTLMTILNWLQTNLPQNEVAIAPGKRVYVAAMCFGFAAFYGCLANGLWHLQGWSRSASIWLSAFSLLGSTPIFVFRVVWGIFSFASIVYLSREEVVDLFSDLKRVQNVEVSPDSLRLPGSDPRNTVSLNHRESDRLR